MFVNSCVSVLHINSNKSNVTMLVVAADGSMKIWWWANRKSFVRKLMHMPHQISNWKSAGTIVVVVFGSAMNCRANVRWTPNDILCRCVPYVCVCPVRCIVACAYLITVVSFMSEDIVRWLCWCECRVARIRIVSWLCTLWLAATVLLCWITTRNVFFLVYVVYQNAFCRKPCGDDVWIACLFVRAYV